MYWKTILYLNKKYENLKGKPNYKLTNIQGDVHIYKLSGLSSGSEFRAFLESSDISVKEIKSSKKVNNTNKCSIGGVSMEIAGRRLIYISKDKPEAVDNYSKAKPHLDKGGYKILKHKCKPVHESEGSGSDCKFGTLEGTY